MTPAPQGPRLWSLLKSVVLEAWDRARAYASNDPWLPRHLGYPSLGTFSGSGLPAISHGSGPTHGAGKTVVIGGEDDHSRLFYVAGWTESFDRRPIEAGHGGADTYERTAAEEYRNYAATICPPAPPTARPTGTSLGKPAPSWPPSPASATVSDGASVPSGTSHGRSQLLGTTRTAGPRDL